MGVIIKIDLVNAIIREDARRIESGDSPIRNISRLSAILEARYPSKYSYEVIHKLLYKGSSKGFCRSDSKNNFNKIVDDLCNVLRVNKKDIIQEVETY